MPRFLPLALFCASTLSSAAPNWLHSRSQHFDLYTDTDAPLARSTLETFEQLRDFFLASRKLALEPVPTTVVLFRRNVDYREYAPPGAAAFYSPSSSRDFIVMSAAVAGNAEVAAHELTHLLWRRSGNIKSLPLWLSEGMAEVYSTVRPVQNRVRTGATPERSLDALTNSRWLPLRYLLTTKALASDPATRHREAGAVFYAQSWLLTHMLMFAPEYRSGFDRLCAQIDESSDSAAVLTDLYGKPLAAIERDLHAYGEALTRKRGIEYDTPLRSISVADARQAEEADIDVVLALLDSRARPAQAERKLASKGENEPDRVTYTVGLAELYWSRGDLESAGTYARKAAQSDALSADQIFLLARLSRATGQPALRTVQLLERLAAAQPAHVNGRLMQAILLLEAGEAVPALRALDALPPSLPEAVRGRYHAARAWAYALTGDTGRADVEAEAAQKHPRTPADEELLARAREARTPGPGAPPAPTPRAR